MPLVIALVSAVFLTGVCSASEGSLPPTFDGDWVPKQAGEPKVLFRAKGNTFNFKLDNIKLDGVELDEPRLVRSTVHTETWIVFHYDTISGKLTSETEIIENGNSRQLIVAFIDVYTVNGTQMTRVRNGNLTAEYTRDAQKSPPRVRSKRGSPTAGRLSRRSSTTAAAANNKRA